MDTYRRDAQPWLKRSNLGPVQKLIHILSGPDGVVPPGQVGILHDSELLHLLVCYLDPGVVFLPDQTSRDREPRHCRRSTDVVQDRLVAVQRSACPVLADLAEEPVLDRI